MPSPSIPLPLREGLIALCAVSVDSRKRSPLAPLKKGGIGKSPFLRGFSASGHERGIKMSHITAKTAVYPSPTGERLMLPFSCGRRGWGMRGSHYITHLGLQI